MKSRLKENIYKINIVVRYRKAYYRINIIDGILIWDQIIWLLGRRILRFLKRVFFRSGNIIVTIFCAVLFGLLIIPFGQSIGEYSSWYDGLWDLRTFILTSILIVFVNSNFSEENLRNKALNRQYFQYQSFKFDTEMYIEDLLNISGYYYEVAGIFLTEKEGDLFEIELSELICTKFNSDKNYEDLRTEIISFNKKQVNNLLNLLNYINTDEKLESKKESIREWIIKAINFIEKENLEIKSNEKEVKDYRVKDFIANSLIYYTYIIADLRRPWRWDHDRNMYIRTELQCKGEFIKGNFDTNEYWFNNADN